MNLENLVIANTRTQDKALFVNMALVELLTQTLAKAVGGNAEAIREMIQTELIRLLDILDREEIDISGLGDPDQRLLAREVVGRFVSRNQRIIPGEEHLELNYGSVRS